MRLSCDVDVVSRLLPSQGFRGKNRAARTSLAIGKKTCAGVPGGLYLMLCTAKDRKGSKYKLKENVEALFTKFIGEGKATVRIREPAHDLFLSKADPLQLKSFLSAIKLGHQDKDIKSAHLSALTPATAAQIERPKTKLSITERKDYPITTSFARSLQVLHISNCKLRRFDSRILDLRHLVRLDLSYNTVESLPDASWERLKNLSDLNLSNNKLKCISKSFIQSSLSQSLCSLDLSENCLQAIPHQLFSFKNLVRINLSGNQLQSVPYNIGRMSSLKFLNLSRNMLQSIPSSFACLRLDEIDLHGNPFTVDGGSVPRPESTKFPTLLEVIGQAVIKYRLPYCAQLLPVTVCMFLDGAMVCHCGRVCFKPYAQPTQQFNIHNIASSVMTVNGVGDSVPMRGVLCSWYCLQLWQAGGPAWRAWCQKGTMGCR